MLRQRCLSLVGAIAVLCGVASAARGDDPATASWGDAPPAIARPTIVPHTFTLAECLALADRNFPNLWAARARLALAHAQLGEAKWTPWFQWSAQSQLRLLP